MKLTLQNTDKLIQIEVNGFPVPARIWEGKTESGVEVICMITRVLVKEGQPAETFLQFERELAEQAKASPAVQAIPLRMIL